MRQATIGDRLVLWAWCIACFAATVSLFVYLPMSTILALEDLSENPGPLTALFGGCAALTVVIALGTKSRPAFAGDLRRPLIAGAAAAVIGFTTYGLYVYGLSNTLAVADSAPQVGDEAPDFLVVDPEGREIQLSRYRGGPVLLVFYRGQW